MRLFSRKYCSSEPIVECCYRRKPRTALSDPQPHSLEKALDELDQANAVQNQSTYACLIRLCGNAKSLKNGRHVHKHLVTNGCDRGTYIGNLLVEMFGKCCSVQDSRWAFGRIHEPNVFSWNIMMAAYIQNGHVQEARTTFDQMPKRDTISWNTMIAAYAQYGNLLEASGLFAKMPLWDGWSWNACLRAFSEAGRFNEAKILFDTMPERTVISWNLFAAAYAGKEHLRDAVEIFERAPMRDVVLWNLIIVAHLDSGQSREALVLLEKTPQLDTVSWNAKVRAYVQDGRLEDAKRAFEETPQPDLVSYTVMVITYSQHEKLAEARKVFESMPSKDVVACTVMITAYAQNGHVHEAENMFNQLLDRNSVTWNAMLAAYAQNGRGKDAIHLFKLMDLEGIQPDAISFVSTIDGCTSQASLAEGRTIHMLYVENSGNPHVAVGNSLLNMYGRCGSLNEACGLFESMIEKNVISWTAMLAAYAHNSETHQAFATFKCMTLEGVMPNEVTFTVVLSLCSQAGKLRDAWEKFLLMVRDFDVEPKIDHYMCMVDLLGRAGRLKSAEDLIHNMPYQPDPLALRTLLSACRSHEDSKLGAKVAGQAFVLSTKDSTPYVLLSNTHSTTMVG